MDLKTYLQTLPTTVRQSFAMACGTSVGHLTNVAYGYRKCSESLAIQIEKNSARAVACEELRSDVEWSVLRGGSDHRSSPSVEVNAPSSVSTGK